MKKFLIVLLVPLFFGCGSVQKGIVSLSEQDIKNAETSRVVAKNLLSTWKLNSGFIRGALGDRLNQLPVGVVKALDELDLLADKMGPNDFDLGYSLGLRVRLLSELVANALKLYAPEVLQYLPLTF